MDFQKIIDSTTIILFSGITYILTMMLVSRWRKAAARRAQNHRAGTYLSMAKSVLKMLFITVTVLIVMQVNGLNVSSIITGLGIASVIIGLALQDALKDIIRGITIITEGYFRVDDVVIINGITGIVQNIGLRSTKIRNIHNDNIISISNRVIEQAEIISKSLFVPVIVSNETPVEQTEKVMRKIATASQKIEGVSNTKYRGIIDCSNAETTHMLFVSCYPASRSKARREIIELAHQTLRENNIKFFNS